MNALLSNDLCRSIKETCDVIARKFDRAQLYAYARKNERCEPLWRLWADTGLLGVGVPEEFGGLGGGLTEAVLVHDLMCRRGLMMLETITNHMVRHTLLAHGTGAQKQRYIPPTLTGEAFFSFAITEADAGTNTFAIKTGAKKNESGDFVLNGQKAYITAFLESNHAVVVTRTGDLTSERASGLSLLIVDPKSPGISATAMDIGLYMPERHYIVHFDDVIVPKENLIGQEGRGLEALFACLNSERLLAAGKSIGLADYALSHAARCFMYDACGKVDNGEGDVGLQANMVKLLTNEAYKAATDITMTAFGGSAADLSQDLIPFYLHAKLMEAGPVNNNILKSQIAEKALGLPRSY